VLWLIDKEPRTCKTMKWCTSEQRGWYTQRQSKKGTHLQWRMTWISVTHGPGYQWRMTWISAVMH